MISFFIATAVTLSGAGSAWSVAVDAADRAPSITAVAVVTPAPAPESEKAPAPKIAKKAPTLAVVAPAPAAIGGTPTPFSLAVMDFAHLDVGAPGKAGLTAGAVVTKVQSFYKNTRHLKAKFRQTITNATFGKKTTSDGIVWIKKPGKMRWDYYSKKKTPPTNSRSFISDGDTIWAVFHQDLQFYKKSVKDDLLPVAITFLSGKGDLRTDFDASLETSGKYGEKGDYVLELKPKKPSARYKTLWLVVDPTDFRVKESIVLNAKGDTNQFRFFEPDVKTPVKDSWFVFNELGNKKYRLVNPDDAQN